MRPADCRFCGQPTDTTTTPTCVRCGHPIEAARPWQVTGRLHLPPTCLEEPCL